MNRHILKLVGTFVPVLLVVSIIECEWALAAPFDCQTNDCGITIDAPYPNIVVGVINGVATPAQEVMVFNIAHKHELWRIFPVSSAVFLRRIQLVSIDVGGRSLTVLSSSDEARVSNFRVGQFVRFAPHRGINEKPRPNDPYWVGIGCVIILCDTPYDTTCQESYRPGLYKLSNGFQLDSSGRHVVRGGVVINPYSMLPEPDRTSK